ncbi:MAG: type II TA system antitoxin MqsA family protein [Pirellulaceae bacterium]
MKNKKQEFCVVCAADRELALETRSVDYQVRGELVSVELPLTICPVCGTEEVDENFDKDPSICAYDIYRERNQLLSSVEIKSIRERYQLSQKSFAFLIGMSESSVNRYESGAVQDATQDTAMRAFEDAAFVLGAIARRGQLLSSRQKQKTQKAITEMQSRSVSREKIPVSTSWLGSLGDKVTAFKAVQILVQESTWGRMATR